MQTANGEVEQMVMVTSFQQKECPVSLLARQPEMEVLALELIDAFSIRKATGAVLFGTDIAEWPCRWYDVNRLFLAEQIRIDEAIDLHRRSFA